MNHESIFIVSKNPFVSFPIKNHLVWKSKISVNNIYEIVFLIKKLLLKRQWGSINHTSGLIVN